MELATIQCINIQIINKIAQKELNDCQSKNRRTELIETPN